MGCNKIAFPAIFGWFSLILIFFSCSKSPVFTIYSGDDVINPAETFVFQTTVEGDTTIQFKFEVEDNGVWQVRINQGDSVVVSLCRIVREPDGDWPICLYDISRLKHFGVKSGIRYCLQVKVTGFSGDIELQFGKTAYPYGELSDEERLHFDAFEFHQHLRSQESGLSVPPAFLEVSPDDKHLYSISTTGEIGLFKINSSSLLVEHNRTYIQGIDYSGDLNVRDVELHPDGNYLYLTGDKDGVEAIIGLKRDKSTGLLSQLFQPYFDINQNEPSSVIDWGLALSISPDGQFLVMGIYEDNGPYPPNDLHLFRIEPNGSLLELDKKWVLNAAMNNPNMEIEFVSSSEFVCITTLGSIPYRIINGQIVDNNAATGFGFPGFSISNAAYNKTDTQLIVSINNSLLVYNAYDIVPVQHIKGATSGFSSYYDYRFAKSSRDNKFIYSLSPTYHRALILKKENPQAYSWKLVGVLNDLNLPLEGFDRPTVMAITSDDKLLIIGSGNHQSLITIRRQLY